MQLGDCLCSLSNLELARETFCSALQQTSIPSQQQTLYSRLIRTTLLDSNFYACQIYIGELLKLKPGNHLKYENINKFIDIIGGRVDGDLMEYKNITEIRDFLALYNYNPADIEKNSSPECEIINITEAEMSPASVVGNIINRLLKMIRARGGIHNCKRVNVKFVIPEGYQFPTPL